MKKFGFTISEALIILGVIGIIAMLTMPTFISGQKNITYAKNLQIAISNFNAAMANKINTEGVDNLSETEAWSTLDTNNGDIDTFVSNIHRFLAISHYDRGATSYTDLSGNAINLLDGNPVRLFTKNGVEYKIAILNNNIETSERNALFAGTNYTSRAAIVYIDVNGISEPNILGRDLYRFELGNDGNLYPFGGNDYNVLHNLQLEDVEVQCTTNNNGNYCAAYLMENGYDMDY